MGLQVVAAAATAAMRAQADLSDEAVERTHTSSVTISSSSGTGSVAGDGVEEAGPHPRPPSGDQSVDVLWDSDMSWGFVRDLQQVPLLSLSLSVSRLFSDLEEASFFNKIY